MTDKRPYDVRVAVDAVTWATSAEEAARLTEEELRDSGFTPAEPATAGAAVVEGSRCGACGQPVVGPETQLLLEAVGRHLRLANEDTAAGDTVRVVCAWSEEYEQAFLEKASPGDDALDPSAYQADIPAALWAAYSAAEQARRAAHRRILEVMRFDEQMGRLAEPCSEWVGDVYPGHSSWAIVLEPADEAEGWPQHEARLAWRPTEGDAVAFLESLPEQFHLLPPHGGGLALATRQRLRIRQEGLGPWPGRCHRCGWERVEHEVASEAGADAGAVGEGA